MSSGEEKQRPKKAAKSPTPGRKRAAPGRDSPAKKRARLLHAENGGGGAGPGDEDVAMPAAVEHPPPAQEEAVVQAQNDHANGAIPVPPQEQAQQNAIVRVGDSSRADTTLPHQYPAQTTEQVTERDRQPVWHGVTPARCSLQSSGVLALEAWPLWQTV